MTDIVERLRLTDTTLELRYCEDVTKLHEIGQWCHEAADEIERLREALRGISTRNFPEGTATLELRKLARTALGEKE